MTEQKPLYSPIHPTTTTSTPEPDTMDGSTTIPTFTLTVAACWAIGHPIAVHNGQWRCTETECTTEPVTSDRPVMPVVARMLDLDAIESREDEHYAWRVDVPALVAEVRHLTADRERWVDRWAAEHEARAGDAATIGTLAAAVGKVAQLHTDDGDGWCKACQTIGYPCPTVLALGAGQ